MEVEIVSVPAGTDAYRPRQIVPLCETGLCGLRLQREFISADHEAELVARLDALDAWEPSQSGRRKRDFGPAINYNKERVTVKASYTGVPASLLRSAAATELVQRKFGCDDVCSSPFVPAGWFFQDYNAERGSNFDPHIDHTWVWGERILDLNLLSDSALSFFSPSPPADEDGAPHALGSPPRWRVDVPLPRRALLVFQGVGRNEWSHAVLEQNVERRRISLTVRELSARFKGTEIGARIEALAGTPIAEDSDDNTSSAS